VIDDELRALVLGYAAAADAGDTDGFRSLFLPDATLDTVPPGDAPAHHYDGAEELSSIPSRLQSLYESTAHLVSDTAFVVDDAAGTATGTAACEAHHVAGGVDKVMTIRYQDRFGRDAGGAWRFAARRVVQLVVEDRPV
jgi:hypothetical protein